MSGWQEEAMESFMLFISLDEGKIGEIGEAEGEGGTVSLFVATGDPQV
jgi:hypothetical protein